MASRFGDTPRRKKQTTCRAFYLLGSCHRGEGCAKLHDRRAAKTYDACVPVSDFLPLSVAIGRHGNKLRFIKDNVFCEIVPPDPENPRSREVKIVTESEELLKKAKEMLTRFWGQLYPMAPTWCFIHIDGLGNVIKEQSQLKFRLYDGHQPPHLSYGFKRLKSYEIYYHTVKTGGTSEDEQKLTETIQGLEEMSLKKTSQQEGAQEGIDSGKGLTTALDKLFGGEAKPESLDEATTSVSVLNTQVRIMKNYKSFMRKRIQESLEWLAAEGSKGKKMMVKFEGRFGKVLWSDIKEDVLQQSIKSGWGVEKFTEFVFIDSRHYRSFTTDVQNVEELHKLLCDEAVKCPTLETFDFKITAADEHERNQLDVRLMIESGKPKVLQVKRNESKILIFDMLCLHRKHDQRLCLSSFEIVQETDRDYAIVRELMETISYTESPKKQLTYVPVADKWNVRCIRHKLKTPYCHDGKYIISVSSINSCRVKWERLAKNVKIKLEKYDDSHIEVEYHNIQWICMFGKALGFSPEQSLVLDLAQPSDLCTPELLTTLSDGAGWSPSGIMSGFDEFEASMDELNECLGQND